MVSLRTRLLDKIAFLFTPDPKNPTAVAIDDQTSELLIARNQPVASSWEYTQRFQDRLRAFAKNPQDKANMVHSLFNNTTRFCYPRIYHRITKLKNELDRNTYTASPYYVESDAATIAFILESCATLTKEPTDQHVETARTIILKCRDIAMRIKPRRRVVRDTYLCRIVKVSEYSLFVTKIVETFYPILSLPTGEPERILLTNLNLVEVPSSMPKVIDGLKLGDGIKALDLEEDHAKTIRDRMERDRDEDSESKGKDRKAKEKDRADRDGGFVPALTVIRHAELIVLQELVRRGAKRAVIGVSTLCCLLCWHTIAAVSRNFRVTGCRELPEAAPEDKVLWRLQDAVREMKLMTLTGGGNANSNSTIDADSEEHLVPPSPADSDGEVLD
ncbi:hypothetical protein HK104_006677 [Borealophlyctis nickersoniae]|nr:hypothetical protein HK104_006677 [Borealophlyctis nickersoniae]